MNKKTKEEKEMKRPGAEVMERFGVRPQMAGVAEGQTPVVGL